MPERLRQLPASNRNVHDGVRILRVRRDARQPDVDDLHVSFTGRAVVVCAVAGARGSNDGERERSHLHSGSDDLSERSLRGIDHGRLHRRTVREEESLMRVRGTRRFTSKSATVVVVVLSSGGGSVKCDCISGQWEGSGVRMLAERGLT